MGTNKIEQQILQMRWLRLQKERSIRGALLATKTMQQRDSVLTLSHDKFADKATRYAKSFETSKPI